MIGKEAVRSGCGATSTLIGRFAMQRLRSSMVTKIATAILTTFLLGQLDCFSQTAQPSAPQTRIPAQSAPPAGGQLMFRNIGKGSGTIQMNGSDIITCGPNQACTPAFVVNTGETLNLSATAQCNTSYFVQFGLPCSSGGSTTRPGQGYCSFVNRSNSSQYPIQMTVFFDRIPPNTKPPIPCK
jgi:hypothetical protein